MIKATRRLARDAARWLRRVYALAAARRLRGHEDPRVAAAGRAVFAAVLPSRHRASVTGSIERRRKQLLECTDPVEVVDFGAGSATSARTEAEMTTGVRSMTTVARVAGYSKSRFWATLLYELVRELQPTTAIELGTCVGISAAYQSKAMCIRSTHGRLVSLEGAPELAAISAATLDSLGLQDVEIVVGPFHETLGPVLEREQPVDYFFNDGHHDEHAVTRYFEQAMPFLADDAVVVLDDIAWSAGMRRAWDQLARRADVAFALDLGTIGILFIGDGEGQSDVRRIPL